jgi:hypothetical protein
VLAIMRMEQDRCTCGDDVGSAAQRGGEHQVQMIVQEAVT